MSGFSAKSVSTFSSPFRHRRRRRRRIGSAVSDTFIESNYSNGFPPCRNNRICTPPTQGGRLNKPIRTHRHPVNHRD